MALPEVHEGASFELNGWRIEVLQYLPYAKSIDGSFVARDEPGAVAAARIRASYNGNLTKEGWACTQSDAVKQQIIRFGSSFLAMMDPTPKKFQSLIKVSAQGLQEQEALLEVNQPIKVLDWKLYQISYDSDKGKWSELSVIEAVRDPWLPIVYLGFFMLLGGTIMIFWSGTQIQGGLEQ